MLSLFAAPSKILIWLVRHDNLYIIHGKSCVFQHFYSCMGSKHPKQKPPFFFCCNPCILSKRQQHFSLSDKNYIFYCSKVFAIRRTNYRQPQHLTVSMPKNHLSVFRNSHINAFLTIEYLWLFIFHTIYYFNICSKNTQLLV